MAVISAVVNSNLTRQKVKAALANAQPAIVEQFKEFFNYMATQLGNPDSLLVAFSEADCDTAGGTAIRSTASESGVVRAIYLKKLASGTDNWFKLYDDNTDDTTNGDALIAVPLHIASQEVAVLFPKDGIPYTNGLVVTQHTTLIGTTDGSDGGDGFVIITAT